MLDKRCADAQALITHCRTYRKSIEVASRQPAVQRDIGEESTGDGEAAEDKQQHAAQSAKPRANREREGMT